MNTDFQNPPQVPRAKVRSHLTIRVQSKRMPRPCPPGHGSKPPVAPKPKGVRAFGAQGERRSPQALTNGDLLHSDEETDLKEKDNEGKTETEERVNGVTAGEVRVQTDHEAISHQKQDDYIERIGSEDAVIADDASAADAADGDQNSARPDVGQNEDTPTLLSPESENEEPDSSDQEPTDQTSGEEKLRPIYPPSPGESKCVQFNLPSDDGALENARFLFGFRTLPTVTEEYPYDVIGPADDSGDACESRGPAESGDAEVWQPERATKDVSGCFRFTSGTEDAFGPYSVIESVPSDKTRTADPEWGEDDADETQANAQRASAPADPEPFYVSTDDVDHPEDERALADRAEVEEGTEDGNPHGDETKDTESADEYADIEDPYRRKDEDSERLECASSEDYVEIGDEDEEERPEKRPAKGRSAKERTAQREQAFLSQRRSCQPRLRLCNITVPQDLDLGRTPELTNRVVFAHTTEAFEEDIEELDCHIVPFHEDTDSDSEEHIYEEAGFDSEGENFLNLDRKAAVTRSRSYSGKIPGYVPETVPEETGAEYQTHDDCAVSPDRNGEPIGRSQTPGDNRFTPSPKSRRFLLPGRSAGSPDSALAKQSLTDELQMKRRDDTLSLPCVRTSSGSFSQRSHQSSSGVSTPTSLVDIPPPFELAYITKRPVTKSSPSLLIQHDADDKLKKKKISFKRLLALKFKRKADSKGLSDGSVRSSRSSSESSHHGAARVIELDHRSASGSPQLRSPIVGPQRPPSELPSTFVFYKDPQRRRSDLKAFGRGLSRVESFEERSHRCAGPLPLTKPRSISFPSADTCDYENIPAMSSDYENIQIPGRPARSHTVTEFFDDPHRAAAPCNENDGYVDMNSFPGIDSKPSKADAESAYTEPFPLSSASAGSAEEDHGRTSEEEEGAAEQSCDRPTDGRSRAFYVAKELVDSERLHVSALKYLQEGFRPAVGQAVAEDGGPLLDAQRLEEILGVLPQVLTLHSNILAELEERIHHWEEGQRVADVILSHREDFRVFDTFISEYERSMALLEESCKVNPAFASTVKKFERRSAEDAEVPLKQQLLQVLVRVLQYGMLLTDYLNNLSPDSQEYEDTQAALVVVSEVADQANDNLKQGENLLRMVHIEYSLKGKRDLLKAGRMFVKEGTLMKVSRKSRQPRHLFLMNDIMLYTYPQQDGKYRLKNTLSLSGMKVSKPVLDNVLNCLKIEVSDITITLSASSVGEREDWFHTLSRAIADHAAGLCTFGGACNEAREKLWMALGEAAPVPVPPSHAMMCMNCTSDFSLTLRRHHCNACGKVVCRGCSRNRYPLKYLKDRPAKVCDRCFAELRKRGSGESGACGNSSPPTHRASRPLSAVFQSWQTPSLWKSRRSTLSLNQLPLGVEGSAMSGVLQRRKKSKRKWKRLWFLLKDKVLYTFTAREDGVASESLPLQGFTVKLTERPEADDSSNVFHLYHKKSLYCSFRADDHHTARRWVDAIEEATVL
ncbi:FYVE, RhoGEF and PH domain-containing protein 5 isoform X2 [Hippocampus comes]|uniref:FYVE, RhoGEF and PH domain-containing protein 5 isoform X2 n=1 Tax=Hippocampus comes TaxID=109280 RepID=UPI00094E8DB7|nr:PREDICTED: FYVE, RhoGEF and PH domain-containing protein 5-like isoform X2 [Hippocampus comes]